MTGGGPSIMWNRIYSLKPGGHWDSTRSIFHHTDVTPSLFLLLIFLSWRFYVEISLSSQRASSLHTVSCSHQQSNSNSLDSSGSVPDRMSPHSAAPSPTLPHSLPPPGCDPVRLCVSLHPCHPWGAQGWLNGCFGPRPHLLSSAPV